MILVTGGSGQLGTEVCKMLEKENINFISVNSQTMDITDGEKVLNLITDLRPEYIIHCAAFTAVDKAEEECIYENHNINVNGTENIVLAAKKVNAKVIYISTDYVFDGKKQFEEYSTTDETNPINEYGKAKLLGEKIIQEMMDDYWIVRTSWVFGRYGNNFVYTMKKLAEQNTNLKIVDDQIGRPTWTKTIAEFIIFIIKNDVETGVYHLSNDNKCSWYEFAKEILINNSNIEISPVSSEEFKQKAKRPKYSVLNLSKTKELGFLIPTWQEALSEMLKD